MQFNIVKPCELVQYASDTFLFSAATEMNGAISNRQMNIENLVTFFELHKLNLNENKTEFIVFSKQSRSHLKSNSNLKVKNELIQHSSNVKYLGVFLDQNLNFQEETKHILLKMACGIKTILSIRNYFPEKVLLTLLNALVMSHLHYQSILLNGISQNLITTLEKQLSWGVKACFHRKKFESSRDLKINFQILPIRLFLDLKAVTYFWKWKNNLLPAFQEHHLLPTARIRMHERTGLLTYNAHRNSKFMEDSFFRRAVPVWSTLPRGLLKRKYSPETIKTKLKLFFAAKIQNEIDRPEYAKKCWGNYRFT